MDSDDEFMSGQSSEGDGFDMDQESDDGSLGDGTSIGHLRQLLLILGFPQNSTKMSPMLGSPRKT